MRQPLNLLHFRILPAFFKGLQKNIKIILAYYIMLVDVMSISAVQMINDDMINSVYIYICLFFIYVLIN